MTRRDESVPIGKDVVLAEHRALREGVARLREARTREEIISRLLEFRSMSREHFAGEEADDGFFESVTLSAPRHQGALIELEREHGEFLREMDALVVRARECAQTELADVHRGIEGLIVRLQDHEARENEILQEVMNTDLGTGD